MLVGCLAAVSIGSNRLAAQPTKFDVNDVSILFPAPKGPEDVKSLISSDDLLEDGISPIWPKSLFNQVIELAPTVGLAGASGREFKIEFANPGAFRDPHIWKIVGIRFDPTAPGASKAALRDHGCSPEIRVILQPVTIEGEVVKVHDYTAHLVFDFVSGHDLAGVPPMKPRAIPDKESYAKVVESLKTLKAECARAGISTTGKLSVHPGFGKPELAFAAKIKALLATHLTKDRLSAVSFMGVREPEPWIFFALFKPAKHQGDEPFARSSQTRMFTFPDDVSPVPVNTQFPEGRGVSTATLFPKKAKAKLEEPVFPGASDPLLSKMRNRDIPDVIANPQLSHFFVTDCMSCHSESTRRSLLKITPSDEPYRFRLPEGISGVSEAVLPTEAWNVRNFGWFPSFLNGGAVSETATVRTGNESAESADFINNFYLSSPIPQK